MASLDYGEYSAYTVNGGIRFQRTINGKKGLVKETEVPIPIRDYFRQALGVPLKVEPTGFDKATAPEQAAQVAPTPTDIPVSFEPEDIQEDMLSDEDFLEAEEMAAQDVAQQLQAAPPAPTQIEVASPVASPAAPQFVPTPPAPQPEFLPEPKHTPPAPITPEQVVEKANDLGFSIFDASLEDLARAMHERFGVYTVFTMKYPEDDEINPFSGTRMTRYERGQAYQAARRAIEQGRIQNTDFSKMKEEFDQGVQASRDYMAQAERGTRVLSEAENKKLNSFDYRTSVRGGNENPSGMSVRSNPDGSGDPIPEPPLVGQPLIRPSW